MLQIGHRGGCGELPENTRSAFENAVKLGLQAIEFDVHLTKDQELVLHHDFNVVRQSGKDKLIKDMTLLELQQLDFASYLPDYHKEEAIITLGELFQIVPKNMILNIEIKNITRLKTDIAAKVVEVVHQYNRSETVIISAFDHDILQQVAFLDSNIKIGLLLYSNIINPIRYIETIGFQVYSVHPAIELVDKSFICGFLEKGFKVYPYTVNSQEEFDYMEEAGVTGVFTDFPGKFKPL